jgi:hypothetical protein
VLEGSGGNVCPPIGRISSLSRLSKYDSLFSISNREILTHLSIFILPCHNVISVSVLTTCTIEHQHRFRVLQQIWRDVINGILHFPLEELNSRILTLTFPPSPPLTLEPLPSHSESGLLSISDLYEPFLSLVLYLKIHT